MEDNCKYIILLEPKGAATFLASKANQNGYKVVVFSQLLTKASIDPFYGNWKEFSDFFVHIADWNDEIEIINSFDIVKKDKNISGVFSNRDQTILLACKMREILGLPTISSLNISRILNKAKLRRTLADKGLSKIKFQTSEEFNLNSWSFNKSAIFKPVFGSGSINVTKCSTIEEVQEADLNLKSRKNLPVLHNIYRNNSSEFILEEFIEGELVSVECFSSNGKLKILGVLSRILYRKDSFIELGSVFPYNLKQKEKLLELTTEICKALGLCEGPLHMEFIVNQNEIELIDLNPRIAGAEIIHSFSNSFQQDFGIHLLNWVVGQQIKIKGVIKKYSCLQYFLPPSTVRIFENITFPIESKILLKSKLVQSGAKIDPYVNQLDVLGFFLLSSESYDDALHECLKLRELVRINGVHNPEY